MGPVVKRIAMTAAFLLATAIGVGLAVFGTAGERVVGLAVALMFGGGGLAWWIMNRRDRPMPGFQIGQVTTPGGRQVAFVARSDRTVLVAGVLGCLAFGGGMLLFALAPGDAADMDGMEAAIMVGGGILMVGVGLFGLMRLAHNSHFALTRDGLQAVGPGGWVVPWDSIVGLDELTVHGNPFLGIRVGDPDAIHMSRFQRITRLVQRSALGVDLSIPVRTLMVDAAEFSGAVVRYREHPEHRSRIGRTDELELIRSFAAPDVPATPLPKPPPERSIRRKLAIGSLILIGGLFVLVTANVATRELPPGGELSRPITVVVLGGLALGQLVGAGLLIRNMAIGRRIAIGSVLGLIALILYGLGRNPDDWPIGLALLAIVGVHFLLVMTGARIGRPTSGPARMPPPSEAEPPPVTKGLFGD